jgi:hypothetical protein
MQHWIQPPNDASFASLSCKIQICHAVEYTATSPSLFQRCLRIIWRAKINAASLPSVARDIKTMTMLRIWKAIRHDLALLTLRVCPWTTSSANAVVVKNAALTPPAHAVVIRRCAGRVVYAPPTPPSRTYTTSSMLGARWRCETEKTNNPNKIEPEARCWWEWMKSSRRRGWWYLVADKQWMAYWYRAGGEMEWMTLYFTLSGIL